MEDPVKRVLVIAMIATGCGKTTAQQTSASMPAGSSVTSAVAAGGSDPTAAPAAGSAAAGGSAPAVATTGKPPAHGDDLLALVSGVMVLDGPGGLEPLAREWAMIDEDPASGWIQEERNAVPKPIVLELPARSRITSLVVDEGKCDLDSRLVHTFSIEVSDQSPTAGFRPIAHIKPDRAQDGLVFPVTADVPGRWVRVVSEPRANPDEGVGETQIMNLHAYGERLEPIAMPQITGTYDTELGEMSFTQHGAQVTGCSEKATQPLVGVLEGRVLRLHWLHDPENDHGPLVIVFGGGGRMFGAYWNETISNPWLFPVDGKRTSATPTPCPKATKDPLATELAASGRVRLYGITFELDSATLRPESKPTLDRVVALLQGTPGLALRIEGHTDDTGGTDHNQKLSDARAAAVKAYLVTAHVDAARLETQGFGATRPAASNASELGRAANRRVELVKR